MKIKKPSHKGILQQCFIEKAPHGGYQPKRFTLDKMVEASGAYKKIIDGVDKGTGQFSNKTIEFTPGEVAILKELFDAQGKIGFAIGDGEAALEVQDIFDGK